MWSQRGRICLGIALAAGCGRVGYELGERDAMLAVAPDAACEEGGRQLLVNGGFEEPLIGSGTGEWYPVPVSDVPGWDTADPNQIIEIWESGHMDVESVAGAQHAELNTTWPSDVYQDVATVPGTTLRWEVHHRGRWGVDTAEVMMGPPGGLQSRAFLTTDVDAWQRYEGTYTVPAGQELTRFKVYAVAPDDAYGNLVDEIALYELDCPSD